MPTEVKTDGNPTINDAVSSAVQEHAGEAEKEGTGKETAAEVQGETKTEDSKEVDPLEEFRSIDPVKIRSSLQLIDQFNSNPDAAREIALRLAKHVGLEIKESGGTKSEAVKSVVEEFKASLPEAYQFLGDAIGPAIEKAVKQLVDDRVKPVQANVDLQMQKQVENETESTFNRLRAKHDDFKELEPTIDKLSEGFEWKPDKISLDEYLEKLYKMATVEKNEGKAVKKVTEKIVRNAKEVIPPPAEVSDEKIRKGSKLPSLKEAVEAGFRGERLN